MELRRQVDLPTMQALGRRRPPTPGMERSDLLEANGGIFKAPGGSQVAGAVGNPPTPTA